MGHLLLCQIGTSHGRDGGTRELRDTVRCLAFGRSAVDLRLVTVDPSMGITPQELLVAVAGELLGETAGVGLKILKGVNHGGGQQVNQAVDLDVLG